MCVFGHPIRDIIPIPPGRNKLYIQHGQKHYLLERKPYSTSICKRPNWTEYTKRIPLLALGNHVRIQNQTGQSPFRWDKSGVLIEVRQFDQYFIRVDGMGRVTFRYRKFLRKYIPVISSTPSKY